MGSARLARLLEDVFQIRKGEAARIGLLSLYLVFARGGALVIGGTISGSLFLSRLDKEDIPLRYPIGACAIIAAVVIHGALARRVGVGRAVTASNVFFLALALVFRGLLELSPTSLAVLASLCAVTDVLQGLSGVQMWLLADELFDGREAKRLYLLVQGAALLSLVFTGPIVGCLVPRIGAPNLLFLYAFFLLVATAALLGMRAAFPGRFTRRALAVDASAAGVSRLDDWHRLVRSPLLVSVGTLCAIVLVMQVVSDYVLSLTLKQHYDEVGIGAFLASFSFWTGLLACFVQLVVTHRVLARFGLAVALMVPPVFTAAAVAAVMAGGGLPAAAALKGVDQTVNMIFWSTSSILYLPLEASFRPRARALVLGVLCPAAMAVNGLLLVGLGRMRLDASHVAGLGAVLTGLWLAFSRRSFRSYIAALSESIRRRVLTADEPQSWERDPRTREILLGALLSPRVEEVQSVLDVLDAVEEKAFWDDHVAVLLEHPRRDVRFRALRHLGREGNDRFADAVKRCLGSPDAEIRGAAVSAYCAVLGAHAIPDVRGLLHDGASLVEEATIEAMLASCGPPGGMLAGFELRRLLASVVAGQRIRGARLVSSLRLQELKEYVLPLLDDEVPAVRRAAVEAAGALNGPELVPALLPKLRDPATARAAASALSRFGGELAGAPDFLRSLLLDEDAPAAARHAAAVVLARGRVPGAPRILDEAAGAVASELRTSVVVALVELAKGASTDGADLRAALERELASSYESIVIAEELGPAPAGDPLADALQERTEQSLERALHLVGALYREGGVEAACAAIRAHVGEKRSHALELLENVLDRATRGALLPLLDGGEPRLVAEAGRRRYGIESRSADEWLAHLLGRSDPWLVACVLHRIRERRLGALIAPVRGLAGRARTALLQEAAGWALAALEGRPRAELAGGRGNGADSPLHRIEVALLMRHAELFHRVHGEGLLHIALMATQVSYARGVEIIREGSVPDGLFILVGGRAEVLLGTRQIRCIDPGECFGEMASLDEGLRSASVVAETDITALRIENDDFQELCAMDKTILHGMLRVLARRLRKPSPRGPTRADVVQRAQLAVEHA